MFSLPNKMQAAGGESKETWGIVDLKPKAFRRLQGAIGSHRRTRKKGHNLLLRKYTACGGKRSLFQVNSHGSICLVTKKMLGKKRHHLVKHRAFWFRLVISLT